MNSADPAFQQRFVLAQRQFQQRQYVQAEKSLAQLLKGAPKDPLLLCFYGTTLQYLLRFREAQQSYFEVLKYASFEQFPTLVSSVYFNLAWIDVQHTWTPAWQAGYLQAWSLNPRINPHMYCLSRHLMNAGLEVFEAYLKHNGQSENAPAVLLELFADACVQDGQRQAAERYYSLALTRQPDLIKSRYALALLTAQRGQIDGLETWLLPLVQKHQNFAPVKAEDPLLTESGKLLVLALEALSKQAPEHQAWPLVLGLFYLHLGQFKPLLALVKRAPLHPLMRYFKARSLQASAQNTEALHLYNALIHDLSWEQHGALLSSCYRQWAELVAPERQREHAEAYAWNKEINPELNPQLFALKQAFEAQGPAQAVLKFTAYLKHNPQLLERSQLLCYLAENMRKRQAYKEAEALIYQALELKADSVLAYCQMILILVEAEERFRLPQWLAKLEHPAKRPQLFFRLMFRLGLMHNPQHIAGLWQNCETQNEPLLYQCNREINAFLHQGETAQAIQVCNCYLQKFPRQIEIRVIKAHCLNQLSHYQEAYELVFPVIQDQYLHGGIAAEYARACLGLEIRDPDQGYLDKALAAPDLHISHRRVIHFSLGHWHEKKGQADPAFWHYSQGNALKTRDWNREHHQAMIQATRQTFVPGNWARWVGGNSIAKPVFIVGMPRTGTSLTEQIICSHPEVFGAGELNVLNQISHDILQYKGLALWEQNLRGEITLETLTQKLNAHFLARLNTLNRADWENYAQKYLIRQQNVCDHQGYTLVIDKMPGNYLHLGLIQQLFPNALVIHCQRHPLDVCLSCFGIDFRDLKYTSDLDHLGHYFQQYQALMAHWKKNLKLNVFELRYEDLIANQEQCTRALLAFLGLDWDPRCLEFFKTRRHVDTASYEQVRQAIYTSSVARYLPYEKYLARLKNWIDFSEWS